MYDDSRQYLGYRLSFTAAGARYEAEVTRAASRVLPTELFPPTSRSEPPANAGRDPARERERARGFLATGMQAHRHALILLSAFLSFLDLGLAVACWRR